MMMYGIRPTTMISSSRSRMRARPHEVLLHRRPRRGVLRALERLQADALEIARDGLGGEMRLDVRPRGLRQARALPGVVQQRHHGGGDLRSLVRLQIVLAVLERQAFDADG